MKELDYDVVIVGSGAGGGTVAKELAPLAEQGLKVAILEQGGHFEKKDNTRKEFEMASKYFVDNGGFQTSSQDMTLAFTHALGGSTTVYTGVTFEPPENVLKKWNVPGINYEDLKPRLEKYLAENNVHLQPEENINRNNQVFLEGVKKLGWKSGQFPLNIKGCAGLNTCNVGCARHAKQGTAVVQIPMARDKGVEVVTWCRAEKIDGDDLLVEVTEPKYGLAASAWEPGQYRLKAKKIVLAGGTMGTVPLLMKSFGENAWPALGKYFTCHPALTLVAEHPERIDGTKGHPKSYFCDEYVETEKFLLETCMYFPFTTSKNLVGFGPEVDELLHRFPYLQQILVLVLDKAKPENRVTINAEGKPVVHYKIDDELMDAFVKSVRAAGKIFFAGGAKRAHLPGSGKFFTNADEAGKLDEVVTKENFKLGQVAISAAHLMGGCRMGTDPQTSVTNEWGQVHGKPNLFVADSSLFPDSVEVNPYLTIMALADRVAEGIRQQFIATPA